MSYKQVIIMILFYLCNNSFTAVAQDSLTGTMKVTTNKPADCYSLPYDKTTDKKWVTGEMSSGEMFRSLQFDTADSTDLRWDILAYEIIIVRPKNDLITFDVSSCCIPDSVMVPLQEEAKPGDVVYFWSLRYSKKTKDHPDRLKIVIRE